jgi:hypothetical protein
MPDKIVAILALDWQFVAALVSNSDVPTYFSAPAAIEE